LGMVNVIFNLVMHVLAGVGEKEGLWGLGKWYESGAIDSEHGASMGGGSQLCTRSHHSK
jgi:hypothetical protein